MDELTETAPTCASHAISGRKIINTQAVNAGLQSKNETAEAAAMNHSTLEVDRRHDLDALRAMAMLLGIVLHAALSFAPIPWTVQDSQQNEFFYVLFAWIHGFRMPLFFMLSGFFTAMMWRKRGLANLFRHRFKRIFLPLIIGCLTIVPAMWAVSSVASLPSPGSVKSSALFAAVVSGDIELVRSNLGETDNGMNSLDANSDATPLCAAVFIGHTDIVELLIKSGADVNLTNRSLSSPLHIAVFMGRAEEAALLLQAGADVNARDERKLTPVELLTTDFGTTNFIASSQGVPVSEEALLEGRKAIAKLLDETEYLGSATDSTQTQSLRTLYGLLFQFPVFMHLWFLWFLCWLVAAFMIYVPISKVLKISSLPQWLVCSPANLFWLIPLTMLPQSFMAGESFGPDASIGMIPIPGVLIYYAIFFFFGVAYWDMDDTSGKLGRWWYISLPVSLLIVFPIALDVVSGTFGIIPRFEHESTNALIGNFLQATFAWLTVFGSIGLFRRVFPKENKALRYLSDSSYWLYLVHLPLVILGQWLCRDLSVSPFLKFAAITIATSSILLLTYEFGVRYTAIGRLLNGARTRFKVSVKGAVSGSS